MQRPSIHIPKPAIESTYFFKKSKIRRLLVLGYKKTLQRPDGTIRTADLRYKPDEDEGKSATIKPIVKGVPDSGIIHQQRGP